MGRCRSLKEYRFGDALGFRGFLLAPLNEMGVVCLFGSLALEMGFRIERVRRTFPDCDAKRLVAPGHGEWENCTIEFEFRSSNFTKHRHDPAAVDLIVCWQHDLDRPPVDVLELRSVVEAVRIGVPVGLMRRPMVGFFPAAECSRTEERRAPKPKDGVT